MSTALWPAYAAPADLAAIEATPLTDLAAQHPDDRLVDVDPPVAGDLAAFFHTGGTTGTPKLAAHTHSNEVTDAWAVAAMSELGKDATSFAAPPLFHVSASSTRAGWTPATSAAWTPTGSSG